MKIEIMAATPNPMEVISRAAGTCYGKDDAPTKRVESCFRAGHMSVFEHASVTFKVEGISRACGNQLVRHRLASFCQESQRYCKVGTESDDWYVVPPSFGKERRDWDDYTIDAKWFEDRVRDAGMFYLRAIDAGLRPEDARYLLPEACKTKLTVTMNCRELFHFLDMRQQRAAQWEIRDMADELERAVAGIDAQWGALVGFRR